MFPPFSTVLNPPFLISAIQIRDHLRLSWRCCHMHHPLPASEHISRVLVSPVLPGVAKRIGRRGTHSVCALADALGLLSIALIHNKEHVPDNFAVLLPERRGATPCV